MNQKKSGTCSPGCSCGTSINRRDFLQITGGGSLALLASRIPVMAGPFDTADFEKLVPSDKKLDAAWVKALFDRGEPTVYKGQELAMIGMPVGGIAAGQLYLGGDGKLWHWDIFNKHIGTGAGHYAAPMKPESPLQQGFSLAITVDGRSYVRELDRTGFSKISFRGEYPVGTVDYQDDAVPLTARLEAFSPFIPLSLDDSSLPATVMRYTVKNVSKEPVEVTLNGRLENAVCLNNRNQPGHRRNRIIQGDGLTFLNCSVEKAADTLPPASKPDVVFEDWNKDTYVGWTVEGEAFGKGPVKKKDIPHYQGDVGGDGDYLVNSHASAPGDSVGDKDGAQGKLTSRKFPIGHNLINFWIGGGSHQGRTCVNLVVDGEVKLSATGSANNRMELKSFDVRKFIGKDACLEIVDAEPGGWGNIGVGRITFTDKLPDVKLDELPDYGTMGLGLLGAPAEMGRAAEKEDGTDVSVPFAATLVGVVGRKLKLAPGKSATVDFILTWHFPNLDLHGMGKVGRYYGVKFDSAEAVAAYVAANFDRLASATRLWRDTWYDSTLPYWFLDRTFLNTSILATSTCFRFRSGRFYAWEGVGCCPGTCAHVWHYAHAVARAFPELERITREGVDLGIGYNEGTGVMGFRAEHDRGLAVDGQSGTLLRMYREHQMTSDNEFLKKNWSKIKKAYDPLLQLDQDGDGVMLGGQMNTLDTAWFGPVAWLSGLYMAALRAGEEMAKIMGDQEFAGKCRAIAANGYKNIPEQLFNGEYFYNKPDPARPESINSGSGCEIDQVFGQGWAFQVGLGRVLPEKETRQALAALWKYNFSPDVGPYREAHKPGRWYAMAGEAGLLMCTFPRSDWNYDKAKGKGPDWAAGYFNECMNGFEYQAAGHMIWENMLLEGMAVTRAVHDRYHALRRNPWNEVECGDHYARSMASYGVFLAACGFEYDGPKKHIGFAPRLSPEKFKAAFTSAEGWGTFSQELGRRAEFCFDVKHGELNVKTIALAMDKEPGKVKVSVNGRGKDSSHVFANGRVLITMEEDAVIKAGQKLEIRA